MPRGRTEFPRENPDVDFRAVLCRRGISELIPLHDGCGVAPQAEFQVGVRAAGVPPTVPGACGTEGENGAVSARQGS